MSVDNSILNYNSDATFSGNTTEWFITCTKGGRITAKVDMYVDVFILGGGGGGGKGTTRPVWDAAGGGGGGGGYRTTKKGIFLAAGTYTDIVVGAGGNSGADGGQSSAFGFTSNGGKAGGNVIPPTGNGGNVPGQGGSGGSAGGKGVFIGGDASYVSSEAGGDGGYAFDESTWSSSRYGAGGGGGCAKTAWSDYGDSINGYYGTRNSRQYAPGGTTGGGTGGATEGDGQNATFYGAGGGGGGDYHSGGKGYQGIVIIRSARGGYNLSISQGSGSIIAVQRTSSSSSDLRTLLNGARIYTDDVLKISFSPADNYELLTHTVNGTSFTSGNSHTVSGDTTVAATARPLASDIGATDANIESATAITVTRYVDTYWHSIQYTFGSTSGYITSSGSTSGSEVKFQNTSISFVVPASFYAQIPNAKTGTCTLTCKTYETSSSSTTLGEPKTCIFTVTASESRCTPTISGSVTDTNSTTVALTGNNNTLVRFKSIANCTITATARNSASISSKSINGQTPDSNNSIVVSGNDLTGGSFTFSATDSRGYSASLTQNKTFIAYINLTINPVLYRPSPTSNEVAASFNGNYYNGSFGANSNTLTIRYRYRETSSPTWSSWITIPSNSYSIGSKTYNTSSDVLLKDVNNSTTGFNYQNQYYFEIQALDGAGGTVLSTASSTVLVQRGIPVFDWGENDFRFNVPIKIGNTQLTEAQLQSLLALISS